MISCAQLEKCVQRVLGIRQAVPNPVPIEAHDAILRALYVLHHVSTRMVQQCNTNKLHVLCSATPQREATLLTKAAARPIQSPRPHYLAER